MLYTFGPKVFNKNKNNSSQVRHIPEIYGNERDLIEFVVNHLYIYISFFFSLKKKNHISGKTTKERKKKALEFICSYQKGSSQYTS